MRQTIGGATASSIAQMWDFEGHMTARGAVNAQGQWSGARQFNRFDAGGLRISQSTIELDNSVSAATGYLWDGEHIAEERDKDGLLQARYDIGQEMGPLRLERQITQNGQTSVAERYFIGDGQDSTRQLLDESGAVRDSYFYDAFGNGLEGGQVATANNFLYTGQQSDGGLYYLRARFYNPGNGRFLSHDPLMGGSEDPITMHRYLYAGADGVNNVDPGGEEFSMVGMGAAMSMHNSLQNIKADSDVGIYEDVADMFGFDATQEGLAAHFINEYAGNNLTGGDVRRIELALDVARMFSSVRRVGSGGGGGARRGSSRRWNGRSEPVQRRQSDQAR